MCKDDSGYHSVQAIYGVGKVFAAVFVAEIGDVHRFDSPKHCVPRPGSRPSTGSPTARSSGDGSPNRDSPLVRWVAIEAVVCYHGGALFQEHFQAHQSESLEAHSNTPPTRPQGRRCTKAD